MLKKFLKSIWKDEKGITGLETAIILIAFVVVAAVFAYTVLSAGLFSTQKSQEAVYSGLEETQSTLELKGAVVGNGKAELNDCDYALGWVADGDATVTRETSEKWEGSGSLKCVVGAAMAQDDEPVYHAMETMDLTNADTVTFWIKAEAALDSNITFHLATSADLNTDSTESYAIDTAGTGWEKHSFDLTGGDDDSADFYGISLSTDAEGTFYLDKVIFSDVASIGGIEVDLDNCDYPVGWVADGDATVARETTDIMEGSGSLSCIIGADMAQDDEPVYHAMKAKDWTNGDTVTFWVKAEAALDSNITFHLATSADLSTDSTESVLINPSGTDWEQHTLTLSGGDDDDADFYGISLSTDAAGTFYLDGVELDASFSSTEDPMQSYANEIVFTVANALGGEPIDFNTTTDTGTSKATYGLISDESTKNHKVVIHYNDSHQQVADLAWTKTAIGNDDGDNLLEANEKFQITVDLTYLNNNAAWDYKKAGPDEVLTLEVKPARGAVLNVERTMPARIKNVNNLH